MIESISVSYHPELDFHISALFRIVDLALAKKVIEPKSVAMIKAMTLSTLDDIERAYDVYYDKMEECLLDRIVKGALMIDGETDEALLVRYNKVYDQLLIELERVKQNRKDVKQLRTGGTTK